MYHFASTGMTNSIQHSHESDKRLHILVYCRPFLVNIFSSFFMYVRVCKCQRSRRCMEPRYSALAGARLILATSFPPSLPPSLPLSLSPPSYLFTTPFFSFSPSLQPPLSPSFHPLSSLDDPRPLAFPPLHQSSSFAFLAAPPPSSTTFPFLNTTLSR